MMGNTEEFLELLRGHLIAVNKELISWEEIYESNDESLRNGDALNTELALASHKMIKECIDAKRNYYYEIESKINDTQELLNKSRYRLVLNAIEFKIRQYP
jgi:hypothetical protein